MKVQIDLPEIKGYEYTGEYRAVNEGDWFLSSTMKPYKNESCYTEGAPPFPILKKKAPVYIRLDFDDRGYIPATTKEENANKSFVEIKALKDAMKLVNKAIINFDFEDEYAALMELIK